MSTQHKNFIHLVGNVGKDVVINTFEKGTKKASLSLVTNESFKNAKGEMVETSTWHNVIAWGANADLISSIQKGSTVEIFGSISNRTYKDKEGVTKYITEIVANKFSKN